MPDLGVPGLDQPLPKNWITLEDDFVLIYGVIQVPTRFAWQMRIFFTFFGKCPYFFNTYLRQMRTFLHICGKCAYFSHICGKSAYFLHFVTNAHIFYIFVANGHIFLTYLWQMRICFTYLRQMLIFLHICRGCSFCFICLDAFIHRKQ